MGMGWLHVYGVNRTKWPPIIQIFPQEKAINHINLRYTQYKFSITQESKALSSLLAILRLLRGGELPKVLVAMTDLLGTFLMLSLLKPNNHKRINFSENKIHIILYY